MIRVLSMNEQAASMASVWPQFKKARRPRHGGTSWIGDVKPHLGVFKIEITYALDFDFPHVRVLSPTLRRLPDNVEGELPHVYWQDGKPILCLFDPAQDEWDKSMLISRTTVPWSLDWLTCYEIWTMTERWVGGGRHPNQPVRPNEVTP